MGLYYEVHGSGRPVVLIHSGAMDSRDWNFITPKLAKIFKVIIYDVRGAGRSPVPEAPIDHVGDLRQLLAELNIDEAVLIGHSLGGQIAVDFSLTYPSIVSKLVLIAPGLSGYQFSPEYAELEKQAAKALPDVNKMIDLTLSEPSWSIPPGEAYDLLREMMRHNIQKTFEWKTYETVSLPPALGRLDEIQAEALLLIGENESKDLFRIAELYNQIPKIKVVRIPGANHIITLTHPDDICEHILHDLSLHKQEGQ